jgi:dTDP-4-dehydrorhamnose 3,5-epimerase-like enzyme
MHLTKPRIIDQPLHIDDRGSVYCIFDNLDFFNIKRTYLVRNWRTGVVRAWHGHKEAATYIHVIKGTAKIAAKKMQEGESSIEVFVRTLSGAKPQLFYVPPGWYNGTMTLQEDTRILVFSTLTFCEVKEDDHRQTVSEEEMDQIWKVTNR